MKIDLIDCNSNGLILRGGTILSWQEVEKIGKCEHLGRELTWAIYYLRKNGCNNNIKISTLGGFPWVLNETKMRRERELKKKLIEYAAKQPHIKFVKKTVWAKERPWNIENARTEPMYFLAPNNFNS